MMIRTKEATDKDKSLKTQLLLSSNNSAAETEKLSGERISRSEGYFSELNLEKEKIPQNTLFYVNQ